MAHSSLTEWRPKRGISHEAIARMRENSKMPWKPMGEAWFMSEERRYFPELADRETVLNLDAVHLTTIIGEISSGTSCFGRRDEWDDWFKFLLPDLIGRSLEDLYFNTYILQPVATAFMAVHWDGITEEYPGYREDILATLFQVLMDETLWDTNERPIFLLDYENGVGDLVLGWNQGEADGNVSAMMMFGIKYLEPDEIPKWVQSILAIDDVHWRGNFLLWLLGAYDLLKSGSVNPTSFAKFTPYISWDESNFLNADRYSKTGECLFLTEQNTNGFIQEIENLITYELLLEWADSFGSDHLVALSTNGVPDALHNKLQAYRD